MHICCAGEVMVELSPSDQPGLYRQGVAGDTFNTAIYLARAGLGVDYLTQLGDDAFSARILESMRTEHIGDRLVTRRPGRQPGLYMISNDARGERRFNYWRECSPARETFDQPISLDGCQAFYFSGITLAVTRTGLDNLLTLLNDLRRQGCTVIFDPNYRAALWQSIEQAREHYRAVLPLCDICLPTLDDEIELWGVASVRDCEALYEPFALRELVIKDQDLTTHALGEGKHIHQQAPKVAAVDTTGAGDAFSAGYLATRLRGGSIEDALSAAQQLAASVVQHRGAILPRAENEITRN